MLMVGADNEELMISIRKGNKALTFILKIHKEGGFSTRVNDRPLQEVSFPMIYVLT